MSETTTSNSIQFPISMEMLREIWRDQGLQMRPLMDHVQGPPLPVQSSTATAVAELPIPESAPIEITDTDRPDAEYRARARRLGVKTPALLEVEMEEAIKAENLPIYNYDRVTAYLKNLCDRQNAGKTRKLFSMEPWAEWRWLPLRERDFLQDIVQPKGMGARVYKQRVPDVVLEVIETLQNRLPEAKFFVSEIVQVADPFLAVTVEGSEKLWVVQRWNEPAFRDA